MIFGRQPAFWIGLIVTIVLGAVRTIAGEGLISDAVAGQLESGLHALAQLLELAAPLIAALLIKPLVTPVAAPKLPDGTAVEAAETGVTTVIRG